METPTMAYTTANTAAYSMANMGQALYTTDFRPNLATSPKVTRTLGQMERRYAEVFNNEKGIQMADKRRLIKIYIADPHEQVPIESMMLYEGKEKLTDATDQELFYELDIKNMIDTHNEKRTKMIDKTVKDRTEYLPPARVRDLRMIVMTVAEF